MYDSGLESLKEDVRQIKKELERTNPHIHDFIDGPAFLNNAEPVIYWTALPDVEYFDPHSKTSIIYKNVGKDSTTGHWCLKFIDIMKPKP